MRRIHLIHDTYNWDSYSIVRSMVEVLKERDDIVLLSGGVTMSTVEPGCDVWLFSSAISFLPRVYEIFKKNRINVVIFGLSDPNMFDATRLSVCDVYCTNDLPTARKHGKAYHFPYGVDLKYFKKVDIKKDIDVLFVGTLRHPYIPIRVNYIQDLAHENIQLDTYGNGFKDTLKGEKLIEAYNGAHLNLDICTEVSSLASRIFQAAACGTPTLTLKREDVLQCFEDGKEILTYTGGYDNMVHAIKKALEDTDRLAEIGENARKRCIRDHGIRQRINDFINT